jgi:hypothetical protein
MPRQFHPLKTHLPSFAGWSVARRASPWKGDTWIRRSRNGACRGRKEKSPSTLANLAPLAGRTIFRPSTEDGPCASRPASEDQPVRVWVQGPGRGARTREVDVPAPGYLGVFALSVGPQQHDRQPIAGLVAFYNEKVDLFLWASGSSGPRRTSSRRPAARTPHERGSGTAVLVPGAPSRGTALFAMPLSRYRSGPLTTR